MKKHRNNTSKESGRVSALKVGCFDRVANKLYDKYLSQFEIIEYNNGSGDIVNSSFCCISDLNSDSGLAEFDNEIDALKFAIEYRDKLKF